MFLLYSFIIGYIAAGIISCVLYYEGEKKMSLEMEHEYCIFNYCDLFLIIVIFILGYISLIASIGIILCSYSDKEAFRVKVK